MGVTEQAHQSVIIFKELNEEKRKHHRGEK